MRTLRARLVLSHLLPMLVIVPLMGIALIYFLETQVLLPGFLRAYSGNAALIAEITQDQQRIWNDPIYAQTILARVSPRLSARVMMFTAEGRLLASTDPTDLESIMHLMVNPSIMDAQRGEVVQQIYYNQQLQGDALDIWEPVIEPGVGVVGIIRITYLFNSIAVQFIQLRSVIVGVMLLGLAFGGILGFTLALTIVRPLQRTTQAVYQLANGERSKRLPESGPAELRNLAGAFNFLVERTNMLEEARRHLLANLVHELGRPLGALRSGVQALMKGAARDPQLAGELLAGMDGELERLQVLLGELTHLYDQVLGSLELGRKPIQLSQWLCEVLAPWRVAAVEKNLDWQVVVPEDLPTLQLDPLRMGQAIGNLISNAVKFTPPGGKVRIEATALANEVRIQVIDSGPGIPDEEKARVFDPFFRGSQGKRFTEGMGLGLSIARDLVVAHQGTLDFESEIGRGSSFTICLPVEVAAPASS
jgi:two-component system, OmpR family, sensor histidine kinase BaeS